MSDGNKIISSNSPLSRPQRRILSAILDTLVPASEDGVMPSAADVDLLAHLEKYAPDLLSRLPDIIDSFGAEFAAAPYPLRHELVDDFRRREPMLFEQLLFHTYAGYYEDDRVLVAIGSKPGPPFPQGNRIEPGDLSLLAPVVKLERSYRK